MFWKWFWKVMAVLLVAAIFVGGGIAIYRAGYIQGVSTSISMPEEVGESLPWPVMPRGDFYHRPYGGYRLFMPGPSLFFSIMLVLFLLGGIGRLVRYGYWKSKGMPYPPHWRHAWHMHHHPDCSQAHHGPGDPASKGAAEEDVASTA